MVEDYDRWSRQSQVSQAKSSQIRGKEEEEEEEEEQKPGKTNVPKHRFLNRLNVQEKERF